MKMLKKEKKKNNFTTTDIPSSYHESVVNKSFGNNYNIRWTTSSVRAVLEPKKQPSRIGATLFPMYKTRYKYEILFNNDNDVSHKDLLSVTFNRCNGATVQQQERIFQHRKDFATLLQTMKQRIRMDQTQTKMMINAPSPAA
eukprot:CAMPEP_0194144840 /NCGR_PEP_ID=MMETSP0152-20130528/13847_1 /TAXON_ID=1049557 /ORGANISM="Thalassiothrix antarctica, Strain L6-D1" /LENGTH=141 /DNA_ID=CAMNT_0038844855 /DNA_START=139 /DNA_END=564 /DNA_ORIENTATION=+